MYNNLRALESNRSWVVKRWIWELLQNARDVSDGEASLVASVEVREQNLTFRYNGRGFEPDEITHLIYYGSTKQEDPRQARPVRQRFYHHAFALSYD